MNQSSDSKLHTKASSRIRTRACLGKPRRSNSYIWWLVEIKLEDQVLLREIDQKELEGSLKVCSQRRSWCDFFLVWNFSGRGRTYRGSHPRSSNYCVCDRWCSDTHLLHAHFSGVLLLRVHSHACYTHAWLKGVCSAHVVISLSSHLLPSHVSPIIAPAVPWRSLRDHSRPRPHRLWRPRLPAELSRPKRAVWPSGQVLAQDNKETQ